MEHFYTAPPVKKGKSKVIKMVASFSYVNIVHHFLHIFF